MLGDFLFVMGEREGRAAAGSGVCLEVIMVISVGKRKKE